MGKSKSKDIFSKEGIQNIISFGEILRKIHNRLVKEGKIKVINGKTIFLTNNG